MLRILNPPPRLQVGDLYIKIMTASNYTDLTYYFPTFYIESFDDCSNWKLFFDESVLKLTYYLIGGIQSLSNNLLCIGT